MLNVFISKFDDHIQNDSAHVVMSACAAYLRSGACKHCNIQSVLHGIFGNAHNVLCMNGAAGDSCTV